MDYVDFLPWQYGPLRLLVRHLFSTSMRDKTASKDVVRGKATSKLLNRVLSKLRNYFQVRIPKMVELDGILEGLKPDVILLDNTSSQEVNQDIIKQYIDKAKPMVFLLPHAPHHTNNENFNFLSHKNVMPENCEYWKPTLFEKTGQAHPEMESQFAYVGYPGLDSEWLDYLAERSRQVKGKTRIDAHKNTRPLKCLFVIRRFLAKGLKRSPGDNEFVYDYDEFSSYLNLLKRAIDNSGVDIELVIKPHPSNDFGMVSVVLDESGIESWSLTAEPIYDLLADIDFVVSLYSTIIFVPAMVGIPVVIIKTSTQDFVNRVEDLRKLYTGFSLYLANPEDLIKRFLEIIAIAQERAVSGKKWDADIDHLRSYYPDGAADRCIERILLSAK